MSARPRPEPIDAEVLADGGFLDEGEEAVEGVPVPEHPSTLAPAPADPALPDPALPDPAPFAALSPVSPPAVQIVAAAATGFVAGAAALALARRRATRRLAHAGVRSRRGAEALPIVATRSFLIDIHVIGSGPGE